MNEVMYIHYLNQLSILEEDFKKQHRAPDEFEIAHVGENAIAKNLILNLVGKSLDRIEWLDQGCIIDVSQHNAIDL